MTSIPKRLAKLLSDLSTAADRTGGADLQKELARIADEALEAGGSYSSSKGRPPLALTQIAFEFQAQAEADISGMSLKPALDFWLRLGPLGWALASSYCNKNIIPFTKLVSYLNALPVRHKLLLVHQAARVRREMEPSYAAWVDKLLEDKKSITPDEAQAYLLAVADADQRAALPVAELLIRAGMDQELRGRMEAKSGPAAEETGRALLAAPEFVPIELLTGQLAERGPSALPMVSKLAAANPAHRASIPLCKAVSRLLTHANTQVRILALQTLVDLSAPHLEKFFTFLARKYPDDVPLAAPVAAQLPPKPLGSLITALPQPLRGTLVGAMFVLLQHCAPDFLPALLQDAAPKWARKATDNKPVAAKALALAKQMEDARHLLKEPPAGPAKGFQPKPPAKPPKKTQETFSRAIEAPFTVEDLSIPFGKASGHTVKRLTFKRADFTGTKLSKLEFEGATFSDCSFQGARLSECVFKECKFDRCDLSGATFGEVSMLGCTFKQSTMAGAHLVNAELQDSVFIQSKLQRASFLEVFLNILDFQESILHGAIFENCELRAVRLTACSLDASLFMSTHMGGVELVDTSVDGAGFERIEGDNVTIDGGGIRRCRYVNVSFDDGMLLSQMLDARKQRLHMLAAKLAGRPVPAWISKGPGAGLAKLVAMRWCTRRHVFTQARALFSNNARRLHMTRNTLGQVKSDFFELLPQLLQCDAFEREKARGMEFPLCRVDSYAPGYSVKEIGQRVFKEFSLDEPPEDAPVVEAIYTIGSVGSIAMTESSDLDYWICIDALDASPELLAKLQDKLVRIALWADEEFDLEITFFVMNMDAIRRNDFGFSDKESSGSAQALLLKEEFYRTALKIAGRNLAWWLVPSGVSQNTYDTYLKLFRMPYSGLEHRVTDMGCMTPIPPGEFFGASLWQLVKAFKSPFKSMMKFGLLDKYVRGGEAASKDTTASSTLLCDRIKENLLGAPSSLVGVDPYSVLFKEVRDFYAATGEDGAVELMNLAFVEKLAVGGQNTALLDEHLILKDRLLRECFTSNGAGFLDRAKKKHTFADLLQLGANVNIYMLGTYDKVQKSLASQKIEVKIDPTDTTRMGRKLFSAFARRDNKIQRIPFVNPVKGGFQAIHFSADKAPGKQPVWVIRGLPPGLGASKENYEEIRRGLNLPTLLAWIVANKIYSGKAMIDVDRTMSPVSAQDLHNLIPALYDFFPAGTTFEVDLDETLKPERITRAYLVLNLLSDRGANVIREASVLYATNWGELFCLHTSVKGDLIRTNPKQFLKKLTGQELDEQMKLAYSVPHRSKCPRIIE